MEPRRGSAPIPGPAWDRPREVGELSASAVLLSDSLGAVSRVGPPRERTGCEVPVVGLNDPKRPEQLRV